MIETEAHTMMCQICSQVVKTVKGDNGKQHFRRHMSHTYAKLEGESRKICVDCRRFKEKFTTADILLAHFH